MDLEGKTVVVTGASRGLGAAIAEDCLARGMNVAACARNAPSITGERALALATDVSDEAGVAGFGDAVEERFGSIDLWINNAGVLEPIQPLRDVSAEDFRRHIDINLTGVFLGSRFYARHRRRSGGGGVLINISSGAAWKAYSGWGAYCAGKAGLERMTQVMQMEEEDSGLRCYSVAPGVIDTDMQARIRASTAADFPEVERFKELKREDGFNTAAFVSEHLLAIAFDPARRPEDVEFRLPDEK